MVWGVFVQRVRFPMAGGTTDEALVAKSMKESRIALEALAALVGDSPFLAGATLSLADLHAYPILRYFALAPEGQAAIGEHRAVAEWLARLGGRASVQRTATQYEQHTGYKKVFTVMYPCPLHIHFLKTKFNPRCDRSQRW
jgi:glutathione S-transferase